MFTWISRRSKKGVHVISRRSQKGVHVDIKEESKGGSRGYQG